MIINERLQLLSEITTIKGFLAEMTEDEIIVRKSYEARLSMIENRLAELGEEPRPPARAVLTFQGRPVIKSHGIFAEFGMNATKAFTNIVDCVAANLAGPLPSRGPIPNREQSTLLITNTAIGSFGFELEEYREKPPLPDEESAVGLALKETQHLLRSTGASDDALTDTIAGTDSRLIGAVRDFLQTLANNEAICAFEYEGEKFAFRDVGHVRRCAQRLDADNVHEETKQFDGEFQGALPLRRTFEFKVYEGEKVIVGKIGPAVENPDDLNRHLHTRTRVSFNSTRIGNGRPRYVLNSLPDVWNTNITGTTGIPA